jgi:hypothetical protein
MQGIPAQRKIYFFLRPPEEKTFRILLLREVLTNLTDPAESRRTRQFFSPFIPAKFKAVERP